MPELAQWEKLAQHWHCTPAEAREQDENDVAIATAWNNAEQELMRQEALARA